MVEIKSFKFIWENSEIDGIKCDFGNHQYFDIEIADFYFFLIDTDDNLFKYSEKFKTWTELTENLIELGFPFKESCEKYIVTQFTEDDIIEFTYSDF
jgi:hypothetical protein